MKAALISVGVLGAVVTLALALIYTTPVGPE